MNDFLLLHDWHFPYNFLYFANRGEENQNSLETICDSTVNGVLMASLRTQLMLAINLHANR